MLGSSCSGFVGKAHLSLRAGITFLSQGYGVPWWLLSPWALGIVEFSIVLRDLGSCRVIQVQPPLLPHCWVNRVGLSTKGKESSGEPERGEKHSMEKYAKIEPWMYREI